MRHGIGALAAAALVVLTWSGAANASCVPSTPKQQQLRADVIFVAVAVEGPTATGVQRFRVSRYLKGTGPGEVAVATGVIRRPDGSGQTTSVSVEAAAGERWRIYATKRADGRLETNQCAGSTKLASPAAPSKERSGSAGRTKSLIVGVAVGILALAGLTIAWRRRPGVRAATGSPGSSTFPRP
jgi:hypothetical protein